MNYSQEVNGDSTFAMVKEAALLHQNGQLTEAAQRCQQVLEKEPGNFDAAYLLGKMLLQAGQFSEAEKLLRMALASRQDSAEVLYDLALAMAALGRREEAYEFVVKVIQLHPNSPQVFFDAAAVFVQIVRFPEAIQCCEAAITLKSDFLPAYVRMGEVYFNWHDLRKARACYERALALAPRDVTILYLLGRNELSLGRPDKALAYAEQIFAIDPANTEAKLLRDGANERMEDDASAKEALFNAGLIDQAEELARQDLALEDSVENHNFLIKCYLASDKHTAHDYFLECREWASTHEHEERLQKPSEFGNDRDPDRRLKVGIVGDYFSGVIGQFTLFPFFRAYDREQIEFYCYNFGPGEEELRPIVDQYRDVSGFTDDEFFNLIRTDGIDIMLDINGRLRTPNFFGAMIRQPAPIQVNWYNLVATVGVKAYNYAITDGYCVRAEDEADYVEKIFRMPTSMIGAWDFGARPAAPPPPFEANGYVTFGCFGDFFKINEKVLETWARLLARVPTSRLYLKSNLLRLTAERERVTEFFQSRNIAPERLILEGGSTFGQMWRCYDYIDIALDTFPYSGGSTTINALWLGIPVVTIEGNDWRGRSSGAILAAVGFERFAAKDIDGYIDIAAQLASSPTWMKDLRATLYKRMASSPSFNIEGFSRHFEALLREIWHDWLGKANA